MRKLRSQVGTRSDIDSSEWRILRRIAHKVPIAQKEMGIESVAKATTCFCFPQTNNQQNEFPVLLFEEKATTKIGRHVLPHSTPHKGKFPSPLTWQFFCFKREKKTEIFPKFLHFLESLGKEDCQAFFYL